MNAPLLSLRELRKRARKSQEQLAAVLHITRSAYSKLERNQTELSVKRACQIAQFLAIPVSELLPLPTPNPAVVGAPAAELLYLRAAAEHSVLDAYIRTGMDCQENVPFDELDENCWIYLDLCGIKTREEYEAASGLITRTASGSSQHAFEQILRNPGIYALFEHGIIREAFLLDFWQTFKAKGNPYFEFEKKPFGAIIKPLLAGEPEPGADAAMISSWPEPLLFGPEEIEVEVEEVVELRRPVYQPGTPLEEFIEKLKAYNAAVHAHYMATHTPEEIREQVSKLPPVNWTEVTQDSDARLLAWELVELVFHDPDPLFAHLRHDPAAYARTLARLVGLAWVVESTSETQTSIDMIQEEARQLAGEAYSSEFQTACELFASKYQDAYH
jgi:transcriptional regulator with XRE-family HTH domain